MDGCDAPEFKLTMNKTSDQIQPRRLRRLLRRLVDIYSPSGKEQDVLSYIYGYMKKHRLPVIRQFVDDSRYNLVVMPPETDVQLALIGHLDTVAAYDLDHYGYQETRDQVLGLGTADMKSGCAAMVEAFISVWENGLTRLPVALALVVGEEEEGDGIERLVDEFYFPWALVGEPTDLRPCLSHYGYMEIQISTRGRRLHASLADRTHNPVENMLGLLMQVSRYMVDHRPEGVHNIRDLLSSHVGFAVPDWCEVWLDIHLPPHSPIGEVSLELEQIVDRSRKENPQNNATIRFVTVHDGYELPEKGPVVQALQSLYKKHSLAWAPQAFSSHSDANRLWISGVKPILLGPGQLQMAHAPDESVSFSQVQFAAELYRNLIVSMGS
jgi:acetylornithine deacetylase